jgi:hypothetical protein
LTILLALSCTSTPTNKAASDSAAGDKGAVATPVMVAKMVRIPVERKASLRFDDGSLDEYTISEYNEKGFVERKKRYSASAVLLDQVEFVYNDITLVEKRLLDDKGLVKSITRYAYEADRLVTERLEDAEGKLLTAFSYEYDGTGQRVAQRVSNSEGRNLATTKYLWDDAGMLERTELTDSTGRLIAYSSFVYDEKGFLAKQEYFSADGTLLRFEISNHENGKLVRLARMNFKGKEQFIHTFEYGDMGELVRKSFDDRLAGAQYSLNYEYTVREEERMVAE